MEKMGNAVDITANDIHCVVESLLNQGHGQNYLWVAVGLAVEKIEWTYKINASCNKYSKQTNHKDLVRAISSNASTLSQNIISRYATGEEHIPYVCTEKYAPKVCGLPFVECAKSGRFDSSCFPVGYIGTVIPISLPGRLIGMVVLSWDKNCAGIAQLLPLIKSHAAALAAPFRDYGGYFPDQIQNLEIKLLRPWLTNYEPYLFQGKFHIEEKQWRLSSVEDVLRHIDQGRCLKRGSVARCLYDCFPSEEKADIEGLRWLKTQSSDFVDQKQLRGLLEACLGDAARNIRFKGRFKFCWPTRPGILGLIAFARIHRTLSLFNNSTVKGKSTSKKPVSILVRRLGNQFECVFELNKDVAKLGERWKNKLNGMREGGNTISPLWEAGTCDFQIIREYFLQGAIANGNKLRFTLLESLSKPCFQFSFDRNKITLSWPISRRPLDSAVGMPEPCAAKIQIGHINHADNVWSVEKTVKLASRHEGLAFYDIPADGVLADYLFGYDILFAHSDAEELVERKRSIPVISDHIEKRHIIVLFSSAAAAMEPKLFTHKGHSFFAVRIGQGISGGLAKHKWSSVMLWAKNALNIKVWSKTHLLRSIPEEVRYILGLSQSSEMISAALKDLLKKLPVKSAQAGSPVGFGRIGLLCADSQVAALAASLIESNCGERPEIFKNVEALNRIAPPDKDALVLCCFYSGTREDIKQVIRIRHVVGVLNVVLLAFKKQSASTATEPVFKYLTLPGAPGYCYLSTDSAALCRQVSGMSGRLPGKNNMLKYFEDCLNRDWQPGHECKTASAALGLIAKQRKSRESLDAELVDLLLQAI